MRIVRCLAVFALLPSVIMGSNSRPQQSKRSSPLVHKAGQKAGVSNTHIIKSCDDFITLVKKARASCKPLVIKIYADWCKASQDIQKSFLKYAQDVQNTVIVASINSDQEGIEPLLHLFGVKALPTTFVIHQSEGVEDGPEAYIKWLHKHTGTNASSKDIKKVPAKINNNGTKKRVKK